MKISWFEFLILSSEFFLIDVWNCQSRDMYFLKKLLNLKGDDGFRMNEVLVSLWYIMGLWPLVYSMLLLPSGRGWVLKRHYNFSLLQTLEITISFSFFFFSLSVVQYLCSGLWFQPSMILFCLVGLHFHCDDLCEPRRVDIRGNLEYVQVRSMVW